MAISWQRLDYYGATDWVGQTIGGVYITRSGLLGGAHIGGALGVSKFVKGGGAYDPSDGRKTIGDYVRRFGGYGVPY